MCLQTTTVYGWEKGRLVLDADAIVRRIAKLVDEGTLTERDIIAIPDGGSLPQIATLQTDDIRGTRAQARAITDTLHTQIAALAAEAKKTPQELRLGLTWNRSPPAQQSRREDGQRRRSPHSDAPATGTPGLVPPPILLAPPVDIR